MVVCGERRVHLVLGALGALGWLLFGAAMCSRRTPAPDPIASQEAVDRLEDQGFGEVRVSPTPPPDIRPPKTRGAETTVVAKGAVPATETAPPQVFGHEPAKIAGGFVKDEPTPPVVMPNWMPKPGHLSMPEYRFVVERVGRRVFAKLDGTLGVDTPDGMVTRPFSTHPDPGQAWMDSEALPGGRYLYGELGADLGVDTRRLDRADLTLHWGTDGKLGWGAGVGRDFDTSSWYVRGAIRWP